MIGRRQRSGSGRILVVLAVWAALILSSKQMGETAIQWGHHWAERTIAPLAKVAGPQFGSWRKALLDRLADAQSLIPVRAVPAEPLETGVRTLRLYHVHTRESLTITYKRDGRYIPAAMAELDYFFRDWRTSTVVSMSGETIDLLWELHNELGSKQPINVICGFRSAQTNALLRRVGRQVATRSEHLSGRAIDVQFPDVPLKLLRNRALARQAGGVGYYPAGKGGFVHIDSGRVRHWPGIDGTELAAIQEADSEAGQIAHSEYRQYKARVRPPRLRP
jgi:uncharacterized protein YcbK (DUF882 family)